MKNKSKGLYKKIERAEEKIDEIERITSILSPLQYIGKTRDIMLLERKYERLNYKLNLYKTKL